MSKVVIVGGGVAGLSSGVFLRKHGYDVEIYEKNPYAGGFLTSWMRKGSVIDGCVHWMLGTKKGTKMNDNWRELGAIDDSTTIIKTDSFYSVTMDGKTLTVYNDFEKCKAEFLRHSQNDDEEINKMFDTIKWFIDNDVLELQSDVPYELSEPKDPKAFLDYMRHITYHFKLSLKAFAEKFNSPIIKMALNHSLINDYFNAFYFLQTLANLFVGNDGIPAGGSHGMRDRIVSKYLSLGGKIFYNQPVSEIIVKNGTAKGVVVNGREVPADYVISAADLHHTFNSLLKAGIANAPFERFDSEKAKYPCYSFVVASYRTKRDFKKEEVHRVVKVGEYSFMGKKYDSMSFRHYGYDDSLVTNGYTTVQVLLTTYNAQFDYLKALSEEKYLALKKAIGAFFKDKLESMFGDVFELIDVLTPLTYERYNNSYLGAFMTYPLIERMGQQLMSFRSDIKNLFFSNQWVLSPGGLGVASLNGKMAAQLILASEGKDYKNI